MRPDLAPNQVERIQVLVRRGFYDGLTFHRVIPGFMAQGGDPKGTGEGGSDLPDLKAEFTKMPFFRGTVAAARADSPDSANSQFFIMFVPNPTLEGSYTVFGRVHLGHGRGRQDRAGRAAGGADQDRPRQPRRLMRVDLFDFDLPPDRIALRPARPRDSARLLAVRGGEISDHGVLDLPQLLEPGDVLVFNDTKVIPAQLEGRRGDARSARRCTSARARANGGRSCAMRGGRGSATRSTLARAWPRR